MHVLVVGGTGTIGSAAVSLVNAGVEGFARAAALEAPRETRVNVVSPPWVAETLDAMGEDPEDGLPGGHGRRGLPDKSQGRHDGQDDRRADGRVTLADAQARGCR